NTREVKITLGVIDKQLHYNYYLEGDQIGEGNLPEENLVKAMPVSLVSDVLKAYEIQAQLLSNGKNWFITFGSDDGLTVEDYAFAVQLDSGKTKTLEESDIAEISSINTFFTAMERAGFREGQKVKIRYKAMSAMDSPKAESMMGEAFWDNLDNRWGVIGLLVAFISLALGSYFSTRRKRRFQQILRNSNTLLLHYLVKKENVDSKLLAKKEKIHKVLQKGLIAENQFLILNKRIEDIERLIHEDFPEHKRRDKKVQEELDEICSNGIITEKEFSRILILSRKQQGRGSKS
ncbi:MAG: hypothetical protein AAF696_25065, partial [Bacteroidota bacterium]